MSRRILATMPAGSTYPNLLVEVACAFGADLTDIDGSGWTWTDVTDDVILEGPQALPLSVSIGRADEASVTQTSTFKCVLDNRSGKYINAGQSMYWPYVRRGTPVRMRVSTNNGSSWTTRFQGQAVGFTPKWDKPGRWATVELEAAGPLRILDQGTLPTKSVYASEIPLSAAWPGMFLYWPCEGSTGADVIYPAVPASGGPTLKLGSEYVNIPILNPSLDAFPYSAPLPGSFAHATNGAIPIYANTGSLHFRFLAGIQSLPSGQTQPLLYFKTTNTSPVQTWGLFLNDAGGLSLQGYSGTGGTSPVVRDSGFIGFNMNGTARMIGLTVTNSGGNLNYTIMTQDQVSSGGGLTFSGSLASVNIGILTYVGPIGPNTSSTDGKPTQNVILGHISVHNVAVASLNSARPLIAGLPGETAQQRITRVANLSNFNVDAQAPTTDETAANISDAMGPQFWDTVSNILRETELTGLALLYDGLAPGFTYVSRRFRQTSAAGPAAVVLDASAGHLSEPFDPIDDDQILFNHYTVSRHGGNQGVEYTDVTGPEGTNAVGDHANSWTVNPDTDDGLIKYAQWGVNVGTVPGYRYPTISFALHTNPSLIPGWLACLPQARIDITNITAIRPQLSPDPIWLLLEGWTETISMFEWTVTANTSAAEPWNVIRLAAATGSTGDDICHMDTDSSQLNTSASAGATSISVRTNSGPLWVTSAADADSFPFYVTVGGLRVQVTAISGASSPQTFTLASPGLPAAKTGSATPGAGAPIAVWRPPVVGL